MPNLISVAAVRSGHHALSMDGKGTFPAKKFKAPAKSQRGKENGIKAHGEGCKGMESELQLSYRAQDLLGPHGSI